MSKYEGDNSGVSLFAFRIQEKNHIMTTVPENVNTKTHPIRLSLLDGAYSVCKIESSRRMILTPGIFSMTVTPRETSVVCARGSEPTGATVEQGWRALYVEGPIPFGQTGVVSGITTAVASAGLPVFVISTFDSDLLFLKEETLESALAALRNNGYLIAA